MSPITVILADDHHIVRQGIRALLKETKDITVVGEASNGLQAIELVETIRPNVLVLDLMMPRLNGLEVARRVSKISTATRMLMLSMYTTEAYVIEALKNGVLGYVLKESYFSDLVHAISEVAAGRHYLSPPLSERAIQAYLEKTSSLSLDPYETLTSREREILQLSAEGLSNGAIADKLFLSRRTVETHRANMMRKIGVQTQLDLIRYAFKKGIIPIECGAEMPAGHEISDGA